MPSCETCGADNVSTKRVQLHGALVEACARCQDSMGLDDNAEKAAQNIQRVSESGRKRTSGGWGGLGRAGKDIMVQSNDQLATDFATRIRKARENKGWDQRTLALRMKERVNIVQRAESGHTPTDKVLKKFQRILGVNLSTSDSHSPNETVLDTRTSRGLSLGDMLDMAKREED